MSLCQHWDPALSPQVFVVIDVGRALLSRPQLELLPAVAQLDAVGAGSGSVGVEDVEAAATSHCQMVAEAELQHFQKAAEAEPQHCQTVPEAVTSHCQTVAEAVTSRCQAVAEQLERS